MKLIKLSEEHYIVVDDSEIKEGDWVFNEKSKEIYPITLVEEVVYYKKKVTHSTQPIEPNSLHRKYDFINIKPLSLSEVKELIGEVDVEKMVEEKYTKKDFVPNEILIRKIAWINGYNQALWDNKHKKYTEEDLRKAIITTRQRVQAVGSVDVEGVIQSLQPKTEWKVEIIDGKLTLK